MGIGKISLLATISFFLNVHFLAPQVSPMASTVYIASPTPLCPKDSDTGEVCLKGLPAVRGQAKWCIYAPSSKIWRESVVNL